MNKAIFLDRDGVINVDTGYVYRVEDFKVINGVYESLSFFSKIGFKLIVITNQSGIGRGFYSENDFFNLSQYMTALFKKSSIDITDIFYCPHLPTDNCLCRKPRTGLIDSAVLKYNIDRSNLNFKTPSILIALPMNIDDSIDIESKDELEYDEKTMSVALDRIYANTKDHPTFKEIFKCP